MLGWIVVAGWHEDGIAIAVREGHAVGLAELPRLDIGRLDARRSHVECPASRKRVVVSRPALMVSDRHHLALAPDDRKVAPVHVPFITRERGLICLVVLHAADNWRPKNMFPGTTITFAGYLRRGDDHAR